MTLIYILGISYAIGVVIVTSVAASEEGFIGLFVGLAWPLVVPVGLLFNSPSPVVYLVLIGIIVVVGVGGLVSIPFLIDSADDYIEQGFIEHEGNVYKLEQLPPEYKIIEGKIAKVTIE